MNRELIEAVKLTTEERLTSNIIMGLIDELPDLQKAVLIAYYYDGFSIKEIAKMQECPEDTVKSMLDYARNAFDDKLEAIKRREGYMFYS